MDWEECAQVRRLPGAEMFLHLARIKIQRTRIDVDEDRPRASPYNSARGGKKAEGSRDHLITRTHSGGEPAQPNSIRARGAADRMRGSAEGRQLVLEGRDFLSENVVLGRAHALDGREDLVADGSVLSAEIEQRDRSRPSRGLRTGYGLG